MPSSSGGGFGGGFSGGGGFNGGFHSSGHSGGRSGITYSTKPFPGSKRYQYVNNHGVMCIFFYAGTPKRIGRGNITLFAIVLAIALIITAIIPILVMPRHIASNYCIKTDYYYVDNAGIVDNPEALNASLEAFYIKTGAQPVLYTIKAEDFPTYYNPKDPDGLEDYAFYLYKQLFKDEGHWLIVLVTFDEDPYFGWVDMHGDDIDKIINDGFFEDFQKDMQNYLKDSSLTYGQALVKAYDNATESALKVNSSIWFSILLFVGIALIFVALITVGLVASVKERLQVNGYVDYIEKHPEEKAKNEEPD